MSHRHDALHGIIEGFYGRPWTQAQRLTLVQRLGHLRLNTYLYAPKDDLRHRARWRELYPHDEAAALAELIAACTRAGVRFVYALAPGLDAAYGTAAGLAALEQKAAQLHALGCRDFAVLFDDIIPATASGHLGATEHDAAAQVTFAHHLHEWQQRHAPEGRLLFCPTPYCERMAGPLPDSRYLRTLGLTLQPTIDVLWTGPEIVSETITPEHAREVAAALRRPPLIWDNLFANDYDLRRLYLGPFSGRPSTLRNQIAGLLLNPNCEFAANRLALDTFSAWVTGESYEATPVHDAAREAWRQDWRCFTPEGGTAPFPAPLFALLCDCLHLPFGHGPRAETWRLEVTAALHGDPAAIGPAREGCARLAALFEHLTRVEDRDLVHTVYRHVWELKEEAGLIMGYLHWRGGQRELQPAFFSAEHRPRTYRGGLVADLQKLLPMQPDGSFRPEALR